MTPPTLFRHRSVNDGMTAMKENIRRRLFEAGASAVGFARADEVDAEARRRFDTWLAEGGAGTLDYMHRHRDLRADPRTLLEGTRTVVATAWNYLPSVLRQVGMQPVARYAYGRDYHKALRSLLRPVCRSIERDYGCATRICIDSAPLAERYWAVRAGIGFTGTNGCLIVPGKGSWMFLAEILLTADVEPDAPCRSGCLGCGACRNVCPAGAIGDGGVDASRCLSAITVEGVPMPDAMRGSRLPLLGCDRCQEVCPHNRDAAPSAWVKPLSEIMTADAADMAKMNDEDFRTRFAGTAFMRPGAELLRRNAATWIQDTTNEGSGR